MRFAENMQASYVFFTIDTTIPAGNRLRFRKNLLDILQSDI